jgi:hypothetical protein
MRTSRSQEKQNFVWTIFAISKKSLFSIQRDLYFFIPYTQPFNINGNNRTSDPNQQVQQLQQPNNEQNQ